jgi:hypothetical protein
MTTRNTVRELAFVANNLAFKRWRDGNGQYPNYVDGFTDGHRSASREVRELRELVRHLHRNGISELLMSERQLALYRKDAKA